ncbi:heparan-alpha-glucosaminide N-acetyltransferase domain-containing protein [Agrococcus sp. SGAir0287]|uniref:heparan-alpha-glucosaminide N-acetyltransferase domain-containing protein n=1 Tax=Agrococcus sp. SGAir0287 TaxID=2070347 RepID=UPI0010F8EC29|nr:heparan-alpha-glucosaminide N-acetyltransferase domain-containing protein [Agrococcus sp. SGAir0287]
MGPPARSWIRRRLAELVGASGRVIGLDVARGIAVLGMFAVHTHVIAFELRWLEPDTWSEVAWGNASATFAVLAGVAVAIVSGRTRIPDGVPLLQARIRILVRAALIFVIGGILVAFGTELVVIVECYAVLFAMSLPFLRMPWWGLAAFAVGWMLVTPVVRVLLVDQLRDAHWFDSAIVDLALTGFYPALTWFGYTLVGMTIGRVHLERWRVQLVILASGVVAIAAGNFVPLALGPLERFLVAIRTAVRGTDVTSLVDPEGHTGSTFDLVSSAGVACVVIALCLLTQRWLRWVLFPIAAVGSMSLTAYTAHALVFLLVDGFADDPWAWARLSVGVVVGCTIWRAMLPKGPLEWMLSGLSRAASDVSVRALPGR